MGPSQYQAARWNGHLQTASSIVAKKTAVVAQQAVNSQAVGVLTSLRSTNPIPPAAFRGTGLLHLPPPSPHETRVPLLSKAPGQGDCKLISPFLSYGTQQKSNSTRGPRRRSPRKNSNPGKCAREKETPVLPVAGLGLSVGEDTETSSTTTDSSHDDGDKEVEVTMACDTGVKGQRNRGKNTEAKKSPPAAAERNWAAVPVSLELEWEDDEERGVGQEIPQHTL
ncbi:uncharacterized protein LOC124372739 [Homalodisca vitripennis]|uniref:uncharacterized protein LOC124372739 n=1 Tax=Homalodisca vitripennis TaxID=197043 RepID=UPI001EEAC4C3|nr:uncharacterized protein LOC124372739 [Homalodisca vitripennis]